MSSIDPTESKAIAAELARKGIELLDCPVSGGEPKAIDGSLSVMCGGKKEVWEKYYDLLMSMAGSVVYVGPTGSGNVAKLANQMIVAVNIGAVAEALTFAKKAGSDPELVYQAIRGGQLSSWMAMNTDGFDTEEWAGESSRVQCAVNLFGAVDLQELNRLTQIDIDTIPGFRWKTLAESHGGMLLGGDPATMHERGYHASPIHFISEATAPLAIFQNDVKQLMADFFDRYLKG